MDSWDTGAAEGRREGCADTQSLKNKTNRVNTYGRHRTLDFPVGLRVGWF